MNPERLLQHFDQISEAPDAVPRLRRFILDLAVRGKLVEQDPHDEPASELLKRIEVEKAQYVRIGQIRNRKVDVFASEVNNPFIIPSRWLWARFGQLVEFSAGKTPSRHDSSYWNTDDYPWVSISDMTEGGLVVATTKETVSQKAKIVVFRSDPTPAGTLLMSFKLTIGRVSRLAVPAFHNEAIISIYPYIQEIDPYLFRFLPLFSMSGSTKNAIKGATLNRESLGSLPISLPPLAEQQRIVAKVDSLMAMCDELEATNAKREKRRDRLLAATLHGLNNGDESREPGIRPTFDGSARFYFNHLACLTTRPEHIQQLRQAILNLAVRGKLVPQNPKDGHATELLRHIQLEKERLAAEGKYRGDMKVQSLKADNLLFKIPPSWALVRFGSIIIARDGERIPISKDERNLRAKIYDYYGASGIIDKIDGFLFEKPLLLIGEDGANLINRSTPIAFIARGKYWVNNHAHVIDGISEKFLRYMELFINATDLKPYVTGTAQPKMNQAKMNSIPVALPPLAEQSRIVAKVDELMTLCDELESRLTNTSTTRRHFMEATLQDALSV